jgi:hypothetical protein
MKDLMLNLENTWAPHQQAGRAGSIFSIAAKAYLRTFG